MEGLLGRKVEMVIFEDNQATKTIVSTGKFAKAMGHVKRCHGVQLMTVTERLKDGTCTIEDCHTESMAADIFTKHFTDRRKWQRAITLIGIIPQDVQQKLLVDKPFPICEFPQNKTSAAVAAGSACGLLSDLRPRFTCSPFVQFCPLMLVRGEISEVCDFCKNAFRSPALVCRPSEPEPSPDEPCSPACAAPAGEAQQMEKVKKAIAKEVKKMQKGDAEALLVLRESSSEELAAAEELSKQDDRPDPRPKGCPAVAMKRPAGNQWEASPAKAAATMPPPTSAPKVLSPQGLQFHGVSAASSSEERPHKYSLPPAAEAPAKLDSDDEWLERKKSKDSPADPATEQPSSSSADSNKHGPLQRATKRIKARTRVAASERMARRRNFSTPSAEACRARKVIDNQQRIDAICKVTMPGDKGAAFKAGFDYEDDDLVDFHCKRAGGFWGKKAKRSYSGLGCFSMVRWGW